MQAAIVTISDTRFEKTNPDTTTDLLRGLLEAQDYDVAHTALIPDVRMVIENTLTELVDQQELDVILTTGGTGLGPRDVTPEATLSVIEKEAPGLVEAVRSQTAQKTPMAWLSRAVAGVRQKTLIINLPGSPKGIQESMQILFPLMKHAQAMLRGGGHD